jgi:Fur family ferric uptake transcriptional regulator
MVTISDSGEGRTMPQDRTQKTGTDGKVKRVGHRMTAGREAILDVLAETAEHMSAEDVYLKVHAQKPSIGLTTVYRTLDLLVSIGMVAKCDFGDGRSRFELLQGPKCVKYHHHLVCSSCSRIIEYSDFIDEEIAILQSLQEKLAKKYDFVITNHLVQYCGVCAQCVAEKRTATEQKKG